MLLRNNITGLFYNTFLQIYVLAEEVICSSRRKAFFWGSSWLALIKKWDFVSIIQSTYFTTKYGNKKYTLERLTIITKFGQNQRNHSLIIVHFSGIIFLDHVCVIQNRNFHQKHAKKQSMQDLMLPVDVTLLNVARYLTISLRGPAQHLHNRARERELLYGGKSAQQLSYGFNILDKLESCPTKIKFLMGIWIFQKRFQK